VLASGAAPPVRGLLLVPVVLAAPAWWLARDPRGWEGLAVAQLAAQLVAHMLFVATDPSAHTCHSRFGLELVVLAHVLSAAAAATWLWCGERQAVAAARRAVAVLRRWVGRLLGSHRGTVCRTPTRRPSVPSALGVPGAFLRHSIEDRGPPAVGGPSLHLLR
jgi:hypothetical protein